MVFGLIFGKAEEEKRGNEADGVWARNPLPALEIGYVQPAF